MPSFLLTKFIVFFHKNHPTSKILTIYSLFVKFYSTNPCCQFMEILYFSLRIKLIQILRIKI